MNLREQRERAEQVAREEKTKSLEKALADALKEKKDERPIPLEKFASLQNCERPILDDSVYAKVLAGIVAIKHAEQWEKWGFKTRNSVMLFDGPPGTGKSTTARWIAKHLRKSLMQISMGDFGGGDPGDSERNLARIFLAGDSEEAVIHFDECDALLWDRANAGPDSMWMIGVINFILIQIEKYNGIIILSTNRPHILDKALLRRITFEVQFNEPSFESRKKLWVQKWPKWPLALPVNEIGNLSDANLTGSEIEQAIEEEARHAIVEQRKPSLSALKAIVKRIHLGKASSKE